MSVKGIQDAEPPMEAEALSQRGFTNTFEIIIDDREPRDMVNAFLGELDNYEPVIPDGDAWVGRWLGNPTSVVYRRMEIGDCMVGGILFTCKSYSDFRSSTFSGHMVDAKRWDDSMQ